MDWVQALLLGVLQGLTEFLIRGFNSQEFYRNGFAVNRGCGAGTALVQVVDERCLVGIFPDHLAGGCIEAPHRFLAA